MTAIDRRELLRRMLALGGGALATAALISLLSCSKELSPELPSDNVTPPSPPPSGAAYLAVARGDSPTTLVQRSISALGGIERFVRPGNDVIIKPNICGSGRTPEYATTTNPEVMAALVALCLGAGARRVRVMDLPFASISGSDYAYDSSGIAEAVGKAGGEMEVMTKMKFQKTSIPSGQSITSCRVYQDILETDVLIDVPIAKHHGNTILTLGMKNLLGIVDDAPSYHTADLSERVVDLNTVVRPHLVVVDAIRILMNSGPTGGNLSDVKLMNTIIASHDIVAADSYGATLFGMTGNDLPIVRGGARRGLGTTDLSSIKIEEIAV
ncbi:MAG: DUF362 domain-containing protein [Dehalococcoidia bacterium]|nr:DUF362 domain-containing protein [Dehalococcoidia bacterium]